MEALSMDKRIKWPLIGLLLMSVLAINLTLSAFAVEAAKITVLNPLGQPPPIALVPMAPRLDTLDGKTIYIVHRFYGYAPVSGGNAEAVS